MKLKMWVAIYSVLMYGLLNAIGHNLINKNILIFNNKVINAVFMQVVAIIIIVIIGILIFKKKMKNQSNSPN